jgi:hypothetical protein
LGQAFDGVVIEAQVEHGIHHARQRELGARADRKEQRFCVSPNFLPICFSTSGNGGFDVVHQTGGICLPLA